MRSVLNRKSKLDPPWDGPFVIVASTDKGAFQLSSPNGYVLNNLVNSDRLRKLWSTEIEKYTGEFWQASKRLELHEQRVKEQQAQKQTRQAANISSSTPNLSSNSTSDLSQESTFQVPPAGPSVVIASKLPRPPRRSLRRHRPPVRFRD